MYTTAATAPSIACAITWNTPSAATKPTGMYVTLKYCQELPNYMNVLLAHVTVDHTIVAVLLPGSFPTDCNRSTMSDARRQRTIEFWRTSPGQKITIHCTVTGQMMKRPGYLKEFLEYWTPRPEIHQVWFSLFTPQVGDRLPEMLQPHERLLAIADMLALRKEFPLVDGTSYGDAIERVFGTPCCTPGSDLSIHVALDDTVCRDSFQNPTCLPVHLFRRHNRPFTFDTQVEIFE